MGEFLQARKRRLRAQRALIPKCLSFLANFFEPGKPVGHSALETLTEERPKSNQGPLRQRLSSAPLTAASLGASRQLKYSPISASSLYWQSMASEIKL